MAHKIMTTKCDKCYCYLIIYKEKLKDGRRVFVVDGPNGFRLYKNERNLNGWHWAIYLEKTLPKEILSKIECGYFDTLKEIKNAVKIFFDNHSCSGKIT